MSAPRWVGSIAFVVLAAAACSHPPKLEQPVGFTNVTAAPMRAPERQPLASWASRAGQPAPSQQGLCSQRLPSLLFAEGAAVISPEQDAALRTIAGCLTSGPLEGATVIAIGHTDEAGPRRGDLELGLSRALEVRAFLLAHGAPATNVVAASSGQLSTAADFPGRRVDLLVVPAAPKGTVTPGPIGGDEVRP